MRLIRFELKKIFVYQKGLLFIVLFFIIRILTLMYLDVPENPEIEMNKESYLFYLDQIKGKLTEEKTQFFINESMEITKANSDMQKSYNQYYSGQINEMELDQIHAEINDKTKNEKGFQTLYKQYMYVRENPENRYLLNTNGWNALLSNESLDIIFIILMFLLISPIFGEEQSSKMDTLIMTVKKGSKLHAVNKVALSCALTVCLCLLDFALKYLFFNIKYGLSDGNFPLQSLSYFNTSSKNISILNAIFGVLALRTFGYLFFTIMIQFLMVHYKKYTIPLLISTAICIILFYMFSMEHIKYLIPSPLGFMIGTGYFRGTQHIKNTYSNNIVERFSEISIYKLEIIILISVFIILLMTKFIIDKNTNIWYSKKTYIRKTQAGICLIAVIITLFSGCTTENVSLNIKQNYNTANKNYYENDQSIFYIDYIDIDNPIIMYKDKETEKENYLIKDVFTSSVYIPDYFYANGNDIYYMKFSYDISERGLYKLFDKVIISEIDTDHFGETVIFEANANVNPKVMLGLKKETDHDAGFYQNVTSFFLDDTYIYFVTSDEVRRANRKTGKMSKIIDIKTGTDLAYDGQYIYYVNSKMNLAQYDTKTEEIKTIEAVVTETFFMNDSKIYYLNRKDKQSIYTFNTADMSVEKISDKKALWMIGDSDHIYYMDEKNFNIWKMDYEGKNDQMFYDEASFIYVFDKYQYILIPQFGDEMLVIEKD